MREYTEVESWQGTFSDMHKDVYGFRPRWCSDEQWNSVVWLKDQVARLDVEMVAVLAREKQMELDAITSFEKTINGLIETGAGDRETALRWFISAQDEYMQMDLEHLCWNLGLPYTYIKRG